MIGTRRIEARQRHRQWVAVSMALSLGLAGTLTASAASADPITAPISAVTFGEVATALGDGTSSRGVEQLSVDYGGTPLEDASVRDIITVGLGFDVIALSDDGRLFTWGENLYGTLGDGTKAASPTARVLDTAGTPLEGKTVSAIAGGATTAYALTTDNVLVSWGTDSDGSLGQGAAVAESLRPSLVSVVGSPLEGKTITTLTALGSAGALVQASDGSLYAWGRNTGVGIIIPGGPSSVPDPVELVVTGSDLEGKSITSVPAPASDASSVTVALVLTTDGTAISWGDVVDPNLTGQSAPTVTPTVIPALAGLNVKQLATSTLASSVLALTDSGDVYSWGSGQWSGQGTDDPVNIPSLLTLPAPAKQVAVANGAGYALLNDGTIAAWGVGSRGQLGGGVQPDAPTPVLVPSAGLPLEDLDVQQMVAARFGVIAFGALRAAAVPVSITSPTAESETGPTPAISGEGDPGASVVITDTDGSSVGTVTVQDDGTWSLTPATGLLAGTHTITADQSSDGSTATVTFTVVIPSVTPVTITSPTDGATVPVRPTVSGTGEEGATITVSDGDSGAVLGSVVVTSGTWTFTPSFDLRTGPLFLIAVQDVDGSSDSATVTVQSATGPGPDEGGQPEGEGKDPANGALATTGADSTAAIVAALILLACGGALAAVRRHRTMS